MEDVLTILIIGGTVTAAMYFAYLSSKAKYGARAAASSPAGDGPSREEFEVMQQQVAELAERVDFTERLLAQQREAPRLDPPRGS
jgi:hypothetical protein